MLITVVTEKGQYQKYRPSIEEALDIFFDWRMYGKMQSNELIKNIYEHLMKWEMSDQYEYVKEKMGIKDGL